MVLRNIARGVLVVASIICICGLLVWVVVPYVLIGWECLLPHYDHKVAILSSDVEFQIPGEGSKLHPITLPKGLMIYAPCRHDFARMSLDETCTYKIYLKLDAKTRNTLLKDSDATYGEQIRGIRRYGELEVKNEKGGEGAELNAASLR